MSEPNYDDPVYWLEMIEETTASAVAIHRNRVQRLRKLVLENAAPPEEEERAELEFADAIVRHAEAKLRLIAAMKGVTK